MTITLPVPQNGSAVSLTLRPWRSDDLPALLAAHRDPLLRRWLATSLTDRTGARHWLDAQAAGWATSTRFSFAVVADEDAIGHVVVKVVTAGVAEVGYWTAAAVRGQGVAARALETASRWALGEQDLVQLTRLELVHAKGNRASCRVAEKCGYLLHDLLPAARPSFPDSGHRHVRTPGS
ncbi:GNAT family N-acetyltransferase [Lentzea sp. NPDC005914]|uniref:GNAT family N-acetyltransferase n=1 Tax=Lentzea sp. NPDC005914 TaxID=3154572 RepID=UPI0033F4D881